MIQVSNEWKELHKQPLLPETFVEIHLFLSDESATGVFTADADNYFGLSDLNAITNNTWGSSGERYAFLEPNIWVLDGSAEVVSDDNRELLSTPGLLSWNDGDVVLTLTADELRDYTLPGFTIKWSRAYGECATSFTVDVKNGDQVIKTYSTTDNSSVTSKIDLPAGVGEKYDSVVITVREWSLPERRRRIDSVIFGHALTFDKNDLLSYSHEQSGDPTSSEVSKNEIQFSLDNTGGKWNPLNPDGEGRHLYEQQRLFVDYGMQVGSHVEWVQAGVFYLTEWSAPSNGVEAKFTARDILGPMQSTNCKVDYREAQGNTWTYVFDSIDQISNQTIGPDGQPVGKVGELRAGEYTRVIEFDISDLDEHKDLSFSVICARIEAPDTHAIGWVPMWCITVDPAICAMQSTYERLLEQCHLPEGFEFQCGDEKFSSLHAPFLIEETNLAEYLQLCGGICGSAVWQDAEGILRFVAPSWELTDYSISGDMAFSYPEVELAKPLKEVRYIGHYQGRRETKEFVYSFDEMVRGESIKVDNPYAFLSQEDFASVAGIAEVFGNSNIDGNQEALAKMWRNRTLVTGEFRADPRLELFDVVQVESKYGTISPVMITRIKYSYNGSFHGSYEGKVLYKEE